MELKIGQVLQTLSGDVVVLGTKEDEPAGAQGGYIGGYIANNPFTIQIAGTCYIKEILEKTDEVLTTEVIKAGILRAGDKNNGRVKGVILANL